MWQKDADKYIFATRAINIFPLQNKISMTIACDMWIIQETISALIKGKPNLIVWWVACGMKIKILQSQSNLFV